MSAIVTLNERAKASLLIRIFERRAELLSLPVEEAIAEVADEIGQACDSVLDEKEMGYTRYHRLLLDYCQEDMSVFSSRPDGCECITKDITAAHCAYHNIYDNLHAVVEQEFEDWHAANQPEEPHQ